MFSNISTRNEIFKTNNNFLTDNKSSYKYPATILLFNLSVVLLPILGQYVFVWPLSYGIAICVFAGLVVFTSSQYLRVETVFFPLVALIFFQSLLLIILSPTYIDIIVLAKRLFFVILFYFLLLFGISYSVEQVFYKIYKYIGVVAGFVVFFQFLSFHMFNKVPWNGILPFMNPISSWGSVMWRPNSIFSEPAAFSQFILPLLYISIIKGRKLLSFILTLAVITSTSSSGTILVFVIWTYFVVFSPKFHKKYWLRNVLLYISFLLILLYIFFGTNLMESSRQKLMTSIDIRQNERLLKGFALYGLWPLEAKIFGVGLGNVQRYANLKGIYFSYKVMGDYEVNSEFTNSISYVFLSVGILGGFLYLRCFFLLWREIKKEMRFLVIIVFFILATSQSFFNPWFVFVFTVLFMYTERKPRTRLHF